MVQKAPSGWSPYGVHHFFFFVYVSRTSCMSVLFVCEKFALYIFNSCLKRTITGYQAWQNFNIDSNTCLQVIDHCNTSSSMAISEARYSLFAIGPIDHEQIGDRNNQDPWSTNTRHRISNCRYLCKNRRSYFASSKMCFQRKTQCTNWLNIIK